MQASAAVDIARYSAVPGEGELLVLPGSEFEVKSALSPGHGLHIIHLAQQPYRPLRLDKVSLISLYLSFAHSHFLSPHFFSPCRICHCVSR